MLFSCRVLDSLTEQTGNVPADLKAARRQKAEQANGAKVDRLPPHSNEAEQGVLGCVLLSPNDALGHCIEKLNAGPEVLYDLRHRAIYEVLVEMYERKEAIDLITVQQFLRDKHVLESVGGLAFLASLPNTVPSAANLEYYIGIVLEKHAQRVVLRTVSTAE